MDIIKKNPFFNQFLVWPSFTYIVNREAIQLQDSSGLKFHKFQTKIVQKLVCQQVRSGFSKQDSDLFELVIVLCTVTTQSISWVSAGLPAMPVFMMCSYILDSEIGKPYIRTCSWDDITQECQSKLPLLYALRESCLPKAMGLDTQVIIGTCICMLAKISLSSSS